MLKNICLDCDFYEDDIYEANDSLNENDISKDDES